MQKPGDPVSRLILVTIIFAIASFVPAAAKAQSGILGANWTLNLSQSSIKFQSVKNGTKVETSGFATFSGEMNPSGEVSVRVELDSVDTKVDLRNVRMRFLFFETYKYTTATVTTRMDDGVLQALEAKRRLQVPVEFKLDLHGVTSTLTAETVMTMFADDQISITTSSPVNVAAADFNLLDGVAKLEEAADVTIVPSGSVSFDLIFEKQAAVTAAAPAAAPVAVAAETQPAPVALESSGDFSAGECAGRFEILSRTDAITFALNSSDLKSSSFDFLNSLVDIVNRCPDMNIVIEGHTDSKGSDEINMQISASRADSVYRYLQQQGVEGDRMRSVGYGESQPLVPNDTRKNRARNRRIEFSIDS